jgi:hypothetical protein|tara:strand:- start:862 stop:1005 length:144 start_codon:yes stop_codon:yes gene_type:complete
MHEIKLLEVLMDINAITPGPGVTANNQVVNAIIINVLDSIVVTSSIN